MGLNFAAPVMSAELWGGVAAGLDAGGQLLSGVGGLQQGLYAAQVSRNNAEIMRQQAGAETAAGVYAESAKKLETGQRVAEIEAKQAASGVDISIGSPVAEREAERTVGAMDAAMIRYNAMRAAHGSRVSAMNLDAQAKLEKRAGYGALASSLFGAGSSILSSATTFASRKAQFKKSGAY